MITGASQTDVRNAGAIQGQTRQHWRLINPLGMKQSCSGVNEMDCDSAAYKQECYDVISNKMKSMLIKSGEIQGQNQTALEIDPFL